MQRKNTLFQFIITLLFAKTIFNRFMCSWFFIDRREWRKKLNIIGLYECEWLKCGGWEVYECRDREKNSKSPYFAFNLIESKWAIMILTISLSLVPLSLSSFSIRTKFINKITATQTLYALYTFMHCTLFYAPHWCIVVIITRRWKMTLHL